MLKNIEAVENLRGLARAKRRDHETKTVHPLLVEEALLEGWSIDAENKRSVRLKRKKPHGVHLEDRVWSLLYRMGFTYLSGDRGGSLLINPKEANSPRSQLDVVGVDGEVAIAIECKSAEKYSKRPQFQEELGKHALIREQFSRAINIQYPLTNQPNQRKRQVALAIFTSNTSLSEKDETRAKEANVVLFDDHDLAYYESLVSQIGPAAKYQFLADMLPGKQISGLSIRIPAVRSKMGGVNCYTFSISPEYLLKISYVSHRSKGKASDVDTYQRMLNKSRLTKIKQYISNDGIFPTNIVINLDKNLLRFERSHQENDQKIDQVAGWLNIRPAYKSAWIIDGQHRLFAYSGHEKAAKGQLSVLAFEGLSSSKQAELFIDINARQKSVKQSLLQELYAELRWDALEPEIRVGAIISKSVQLLDADPGSALYQRIQTADASKDARRCITLTSVFSAIEKNNFHIAKEKGGHVVEYGPLGTGLWAGDNETTLKRTSFILQNWFNAIRNAVPDWWDKGSGPGGGLAMNDGVTTCVNVLHNVFQHLETNGKKLVSIDNEDLLELIGEYAKALGVYFGSLSEEERKRFRDLRGAQGQQTRTKRCQRAIREYIPSFNPPGLDEFLQLEKAQTNVKAKEIVDRIETTLQKTVIEELRREYKADESQWWTMGIPRNIRRRVTDRREEDDDKRGGREYYFDLIDYRNIALENWRIFEPLLGYGKANSSKDKRTTWMNDVNEARKIVSHASSGVSISIEHLNELEKYDKWLSEQVAGTGNGDEGE